MALCFSQHHTKAGIMGHWVILLPKWSRPFSTTPITPSWRRSRKTLCFQMRLWKNFKHQLEDYRILSFYESIPLKTVGIIVDKKSATLGLPGSREQQLPLEADHSEVCKFVSPSDSNYEMVIGNLSEMVENALKESVRT